MNTGKFSWVRNVEIWNVLILFLVISSISGCTEETDSTPEPTLPQLNTTVITDIKSRIAFSGGNITSDGNTNIIAKGVCWSTSAGPSISDAKTSNGPGSGIFTSYLSSLVPGTNYYVRAYATNSVGTAYGNELSFTTEACGTTVTDVDANTYDVVSIGNQCWLQENLKTGHYKNGDPIPTDLGTSAWGSTTSGAYGYTGGNSSRNAVFGKLYNHYAVADSRGICPEGWHVPSENDWTELTTYLGGLTGAGDKMKSTTLWLEPHTVASNSSGFTGIAGGSIGQDGSSSDVGDSGGAYGGWWSATEYAGTNAWSRGLYNFSSDVWRESFDKNYGFSVRCVKD